ncbi:MAG: GNAT family N-acetyltransferase [Ferruginibacter sp.]
MKIIYKTDVKPGIHSIIELYENAGLPRPTKEVNRISEMYEHANMVVSAWDGERLIGISRSLTDFSWCCYLADLAVRDEYKKLGIGKKLIEITKDQIGEGSMLLLLSVPTAMEYYPKVGLKEVTNGFIINRKK